LGISLGNVPYYSSDQGLQIGIEPTPSYFNFVASATRSNGEVVASSFLGTTSTAATGASVSITYAPSGAVATLALDLSGIEYRVLDWNRDVKNTVVGFTNVESKQASRRALDTVKNRIDSVSTLEGQYGAIESRLNVAHNLLATSGENFAAASSRIKDADIASEAATSVRSGILQQAATSLLAQANQAPRIALSLLSGI
jgi:flagellin